MSVPSTDGHSAKVVEIMENDASNETEDHIIGYVEQFVGNMTQDALRKPKVYWCMDSIDTFLANYFIVLLLILQKGTDKPEGRGSCAAQQAENAVALHTIYHTRCTQNQRVR